MNRLERVIKEVSAVTAMCYKMRQANLDRNPDAPLNAQAYIKRITDYLERNKTTARGEWSAD